MKSMIQSYGSVKKTKCRTTISHTTVQTVFLIICIHYLWAYLAQNLTLSEIADLFCSSEHTIRRYMSHYSNVLGTPTR